MVGVEKLVVCHLSSPIFLSIIASVLCFFCKFSQADGFTTIFLGKRFGNVCFSPLSQWNGNSSRNRNFRYFSLQIVQV
ncbi:hypothetical protein MLD38_011921 [Melastoma candidum]|uniref:Uncharacterized protein n=1 Tax=Melastoma candidum TaxID=119954 RepID=A0ACB9R5R3_9MYRT|nr:hypothetical protein MLD38_011921 [Melastoma candidum]